MKYIMIVDVETIVHTETESELFDFSAIVVNRKGEVQDQIAVVIKGTEYNNGYYKKNYGKMIDNGDRVVATNAFINKWLEKVKEKYNPTLTAYNLAFDSRICSESGVMLSLFESRFCLWQAALGNLLNTAKYKTFALENLYFGKRTDKANMCIQTNAEVVAHFVTGEYKKEPHTGLEDILYFELPILLEVIKKRNWQSKIVKFNWRDWQVKLTYKVA